MLFKKVVKLLTVSNFFSRHVRLFTSYDKNFDYFRTNQNYKNLVVQLNKSSNSSTTPEIPELPLLNNPVAETDELFKQLLQRENVMKLTPIQVKDILSFMMNKDKDIVITKYSPALIFLDEKCALSAQRWPLDLSFYILDLWLLIWGSRIFKKHYYASVTSQWSRKITKCSKFNLVLILYFIGRSKSALPLLMESVVARMENCISEFSDEEIATVCLSFFKCSEKIKSSLLLKQSCRAAEHLLEKHDRFNAISILKCLRLSKYYDPELWDNVKTYSIRQSTSFNFVQCTNFLALFAAQNIYDKLLFTCLEKQGSILLFKELDSDVNDFKAHPSVRSRVKDISRFFWSLTAVGHSVEKNTLTVITDCTRKRMQTGEYDSQLHILIDLLQSFVLANHYYEEIFCSVLTPSIFRQIKNSDRAKAKYQLYFVQRSVAIEHPEISVSSKVAVSKSIPKQLEIEINERLGFRELVDFLQQYFPRCFKCCYILPHIMIAGIIFSKDGISSSVSLNTYHKYISDGMISKQVKEMFQSNKEYFCIEILDSSVCAVGSDEPLGLMKTKIRQLNKLNFKVITCTSTDIMNINEKNSHLRLVLI